MAEFNNKKTTYLIEFTHDEVIFLRGLTQNKQDDYPVHFESERAAIFNALNDAMEKTQ